MAPIIDLQRYQRTDATGDRAGLFTWFTLFPVTVWSSVVQSAAVKLTVTGSGQVRVLKLGTAASDVPETITTLQLESGSATVSVPLRGAAWLSLDAHDSSVIDSVTWSVPGQCEIPRVTAVIPTFKREHDATHQARTFLSSELVGHAVVIDQGGTLADHAPFQKLVGEHPERLILIQQPNLGGSGGYARGMLESLTFPKDAVLLSDDDAALPEEALRRMLLFQALAVRAGRKIALATPMFSSEEPTELISASERVSRRDFQWGAADSIREPYRLSEDVSDIARALAHDEPANYAGWWGALLPPGMIADVGLAAPYFLKWDDSEYGLRAIRQGYEFVALPGTGVWHPTWGAHKTLATWVGMLLHRNRLATAAAYGAGRGVVLDSLVHQIKHVLSLQYGAAELWNAAIREFLSGPAWLGADLPEARNKAQAVVDSLPSTELRGELPALRRKLGIAVGALRAATGMVRSVPRDEVSGAVESVCPAAAFNWRDGLGMDRVVLLDDDGAPVSDMRRDPRLARSLMATAVSQHVTLAVKWRGLRDPYRQALARGSSEESWRGFFDAR